MIDSEFHSEHRTCENCIYIGRTHLGILCLTSLEAKKTTLQSTCLGWTDDTDTDIVYVPYTLGIMTDKNMVQLLEKVTLTKVLQNLMLVFMFLLLITMALRLFKII